MASEDVDLFAELPIVLSVSRMAQPLNEAPGSVTVIDQELIRASGARVISDLLRLVPGFQVTTASQEPARVTYHGLSSQYPSHLQVLVDGVSQYSPLYQGGVNWNLIPVALQDIERIEVMRGSNSAAYGSDAFLGVVNIITQQAAQTRGVAFAVNTGNGQTNDYFARWGVGTPGADFRLSVSGQFDSGIDRKIDEDTGAPASFNDNRDNRTISLRSDFYPTDRDTVRLSFSQVQNNNGQDGHIETNGFVTAPVFNFLQRDQTLQANWQHTLSPNEDIRVNYAWTRQFGDDSHFEYYGPPGVPSGTVVSVNSGGNAQRQDFDAQHMFSPSAGLRVIWGVGVRTEWVQMPLYFYGNQRHNRNSKRVFGNAEWAFAPGWLLNLGGNLEHDSLGGTMPAPRISLHRHLNDENTLRFGASRAFRSPSLIEQYTDLRYVPVAGPLVGTYLSKGINALAPLSPERIESYEIGYLGDFRKYHASLDLRIFLEHIPNLIQEVATHGKTLLPAPYCPDPNSLNCADNTLTANYSRNVADVYIRGAEYQFRWRAPTDTRVLFNQAFTSISAKVPDLSPFDDTSNINSQNVKIIRHAQTSVPAVTTTLMLIQQLPWNTQVSLTLARVGQMRWTRNELLVDAHNRVDWRLSKKMQIGGRNVEIAYTGRSTSNDDGDYRPNWLVPPRHFVSLSVGL